MMSGIKTEHLRILQQKHIHHRNTKCDNPPPLPSHKVVEGEGNERETKGRRKGFGKKGVK